MTTEGDMAPLTDVNYLGDGTGPLPAAVSERWAVDAAELREGSSAARGRREGGDPGPGARWQWVAVPPFVGGEATAALEAATGDGPRLVRLCPGRAGSGYPLAGWLLAPLPELCDHGDVALALDYTGVSDMPWGEVVDLARRHPGLCLVVMGRGGDELGVMTACLDATANLVFETSALGDPAWLRRAVTAVGAHRFVFGSGGEPSRAAELLGAAGLAPDEASMVGSGVAGLIDAGSWAESWL
jgi:hypothetical protein